MHTHTDAISPDDVEVIMPKNEKSPVDMKITIIGRSTEEEKLLSDHYENRKPYPVNLSWHKVSYTAKRRIKNKQIKILKDLTGEIRTGELLGILGPSGAGKTTFLNILTGFINKKVNGTICMNGEETSPKSFRKFLCYIQHDNQMLLDLTLKETLIAAANLKLHKTLSREEKCHIVKNAIQFWSLSECKDTLIRRLSSGQKKRLSIAQEVINKPSLICLDEPTSSLDSSGCLQCISLLKDLAKRGHTVICIIHQPSARLFEYFDKLLILTQGQCLYHGATKELLSYLSNFGVECPLYHNPADFVIEIALGQHGMDVAKQLIAENNRRSNQTEISYKNNSAENKCDKSNNADCMTIDMNLESNGAFDVPSLFSDQNLEYSKISDFPTSSWNQFLVLFGRAMLCIIREPTITRIIAVSYIVFGITLGLIYYDIGNDASKVHDNVSCLVLALVYVIFTSMMLTVVTFPLELSVFRRENFNRWYALKMYYLARTFADLPFQIFFPIIFMSIVYWMTNQINDSSRFILFIMMYLATSIVSQSIGFCFGALMNIQIAVILTPVVVIPPALFCGFFVRFNVLPSYMRWLSYLSYIRYSYEGILLTLYSFNRTSLECPSGSCLYQEPEYFLQEMGIQDSLLYVNFIFLFCLFVLLRVVAFLLLSWKTKNAH